MKTRKRRQTKVPPRKPQEYEPHIEVVLEGTGEAIDGIQCLMKYLLHQQAPDWNANDWMVEKAVRHFKCACFWLAKTRNH